MRWSSLTLLALVVAGWGVTSSLPAETSQIALRKRLLGIDVSRLERTIGWRGVADSGVEFAIVQASRGSGDDCAVHPKRCGADPFYLRNYTRARAVGIRVGPYHRAFTGGDGARAVKRDALDEAQVFLDRVEVLRAGDLLPALDVEPPFRGLSAGELRLWVRTWLSRVRTELGTGAIIYTSATAWRALGDTPEFARKGNRLWVAHWGVDRPAVPARNWDGRGWSVWQFTNNRRIKGIAGLPDADWLRGGFAKVSVGERVGPAG